jgi:hypothetical protein
MYCIHYYSTGWIDISNLSAKVPQINNSIFVKILKLPGDQSNKLFNKQKLTAIGLINTQSHPQSHLQNHSSTNNIHTPIKKVVIPTTPKSIIPISPKNEAMRNHNLIDF